MEAIEVPGHFDLLVSEEFSRVDGEKANVNFLHSLRAPPVLVVVRALYLGDLSKWFVWQARGGSIIPGAEPLEIEITGDDTFTAKGLPFTYSYISYVFTQEFCDKQPPGSIYHQV